ncbi:MAG: hypothetical protein RIS94_571 [Pseudomonadota bacterium]
MNHSFAVDSFTAVAVEPIPAGAADGDSVAIVVTTYNHAHFLADALASITRQTRAADDVLVVDDGSTDDPAAVVAQFPGVRLLRTPNRGLAAARNAGIAAIDTRYVVFLDADDVLLPDAVSLSLACMAANPDAAMACGSYRFAGADLTPCSGPVEVRVGPQGHAALLRGNQIGMNAVVLFDREKLVECGSFDPALPRCEDYDAYLRIAARHRIASHRGLVALYRLHGANMSQDAAEMLAWNRRVLDRHRPRDDDPVAMRAWTLGMQAQVAAFANAVWTERGTRGRDKWLQRRRMMAIAPWPTTKAALRQTAIRLLPRPLADTLREFRRRRIAASVGRIDFGDLARIKPVSEGFGFRRGTPVDRFYIERFLTRNAPLVTGAVLEAADDKYSRRFGQGITRQEVLDISPDLPGATIIGDLSKPGVLPADTFDCIILTQTLQYVYELKTAVEQLHQSLRPGGVVLATMPALSPIDTAEWDWHWIFTARVVTRLFGEAFGDENVEVCSEGNAFVATCFLQGVAIEDVGEQWLVPNDPSFPICITVKARRAA